MIARGNALASALPAGAHAEDGPRLRDYWTLTKPNVMQLVVFTGLAGLLLAPGALHPLLAFTAILCIAAGAAACAAINNGYDADIDLRMARTRLRPTAAGRILPVDAMQLGMVLAVLSVMVMGLALNWLAAGLLAFTILFYCVVYTMWLKRSTPHNIVIGGLAGAFPPLIGWAAVTGEVAALPLILVLVVFLWTPAHFWALALYRMADYGKVGVPMLPVVRGRAETRDQILLYTALTVAVSLVPLAMGDLGLVYGAAALGLGGRFLLHAVALHRGDSDIVAMRTFRYSIIYLFALFAAMVADHWLVSPLALLS